MSTTSTVSSKRRPTRPTRAGLAIVFGDQLGLDAALIGLLGRSNKVPIMDVAIESRNVPSRVERTVLVLSAMRQFAAELIRRDLPVRYKALDDSENTDAFETEIIRTR